MLVRARMGERISWRDAMMYAFEGTARREGLPRARASRIRISIYTDERMNERLI